MRTGPEGILRDPIHITCVAAYCDGLVVRNLAVADLQIHLYYRYACVGKHTVYRVWYYLGFQTSTEGLGTWIREHC